MNVVKDKCPLDLSGGGSGIHELSIINLSFKTKATEDQNYLRSHQYLKNFR